MSKSVAKTARTPRLRFPEFSGEWEEKTLKEVFCWIPTNSLPRVALSEKGKIQNIHYGDIHTRYPILFDQEAEEIPYLNENEVSLKLSPEHYCRVGDIIFADASEDYADVGKAIEIVKVKDKSMVAGLHTLLARPIKATEHTGFFGQLFASPGIRAQIEKSAQGISVLGISKGSLEKVKLRIPTPAEREKISALLRAMDMRLAGLNAQHKALKQYKRGVMQKIFSRQIRFTRDDGPAFPDWEEVMLGSIAEIVGGGTPDSFNSEYWDGDIEWFTPTEIKKKYLSKSNRRITQNGLRKSSATLLPPGTLLLSTRATIGEVGISLIESSTNQGFQSLICRDAEYNEYWYYWIKQNAYEFTKRASGSTFAEISKRAIESIPAMRPCLEEQRKIADFLSSIDRRIDLISNTISETRAFKKGLLQQMFV